MADDVDEMVRALEAEYERIVIDLVVETVANLREDTPVDTGHARANWVQSVGEPFRGLDGETRVLRRGNKKKGTKKGDRVTTSTGSAAARGDAAILSYKLDDGDAYVANNVDYLVGPGSLNDGHSDQAASGWIEAAVARALAKVGSQHDQLADLVGVTVADVRV